MSARPVARLGALVLLLGGLFVWAAASGAGDLSVAALRARVDQAGPWAIGAYAAAFSLGLLVYAPGMMFVLVAAALWGRWQGMAIAWGAGVLAMLGPFLLVRVVGGAPILAEVRRPLVRRLVDQVAARPILSVAALRLIFWFGPVLNYGLALAPITTRDYVIGSAVGILPPIVAISAVYRLIAA